MSDRTTSVVVSPGRVSLDDLAQVLRIVWRVQWLRREADVLVDVLRGCLDRPGDLPPQRLNGPAAGRNGARAAAAAQSR